MWSSSYRGRAGYASDSDSDVDADPTDTLLRQMDLSRRHESVEYRPNPWSIARINAASRPAPARLPQPKPIVEASKKQAKRGSLRDALGADKSCAGASDKSRESALPAHKPTTHAVEKQTPAHISTVSDQLIHAPPFKPRRTFGTHRVLRSSPVRLLAPTFHHSSPGPRFRVPVSAHTMRPSSPPPAPPCTDRTPTKDRPGNTRPGTAPNWLKDALGEALSAPRQDATDPPHIRTPEPKRRRLASSEPTPPRASATRPPDPGAPRRGATAYAFGEDHDPDAAWSTLARTKRKAKPSGTRQSGQFRLPLLGLARAPKEGPRVITYLPPPMASKKRADDGLRPATKVQVQAVVAAATDPPIRVEVEEEEEVEEMRVMDSDMTLVNEDDEGVAQIDVDDVCARYPATRACMKAAGRVRRAVGCVVELRT